MGLDWERYRGGFSCHIGLFAIAFFLDTDEDS
jgi:hypothetical protein